MKNETIIKTIVKETIKGMAHKAILIAKTTPNGEDAKNQNWTRLFDNLSGREACACGVLNQLWTKENCVYIEQSISSIQNAKRDLLECYDAETFPIDGSEYYSFPDVYANKF